MSKLDYQSLANKVRSIDPYRGTMRYPMDNRSNRQNLVELVETESDVEFHISHGYSYEQVEISEARYKLMEGVRGANVHKKDREWERYDYYTTKITPRVLCVVRSDNTLEYVNGFHQGDNMKMSDWSRGLQYDSHRMGGTAYAEYNGSISHPIFKGLRINQETHEPVGMDVQVFRRTVDRKKSKELMLAYKEAFKSPDAFLKCMDTDTMITSIKDVLDEKEATLGENHGYVSTGQYFKLAEEAFANKENFEAVVLYGMSIQIEGFNHWALQNYAGGNRYSRMIDPKNVVARVVANLSRKLYKEHKPFHEEEVAFTKTKGSQWGLRVVADGKEVIG